MRIVQLATTSDEMLTLDFLRFYASAAIVLHHSHEFLWPRSARPWLDAQTGGLALFVDLFFLISGFVIAQVYSGRVGNLAQFGRFMQRRIGRLFPLHLLTLGLAIIMWALVGRYASADHVPSQDLRCIALTAGLAHALISCGNGIYYNGVSWSISAEMVMYVLFPLLGALAFRWRRLFLVCGLGVFAWLLAVAVAANSTVAGWVDHYAPLRALPAFMIGVGLNANRDLLARMPAARLLMVWSLAGASLSALSGAPTLVQVPLFYLAGASAMALDVQKGAGPLVTRLAPLGQLTYSIYLWHGFFIIVLVNAIGDKLLGGRLLITGALLLVCYVAILVWSYLSWRYFETPARRWVDGLFAPDRPSAELGSS